VPAHAIRQHRSPPDRSRLNESELAVDHLFRHQSGKMIGALTRVFGARRLDLVEEVVQDALLRALEIWPYQGIPDNPSAWLIQVAKNRAMDVIRREVSLAEKLPELTHALPAQTMPGESPEVLDDQLSMMFLCCHPRLAREVQVVLTLKTVAGFSVREISRAFLAQEAAIAQRLVRGKRQIRDQHIEFEMPAGQDFRARLDSVLEVLYLLFNEGYSALEGDSLLRADLCEEAIRLAKLLAAHPLSDLPAVHAMLALFLFNSSRLPARVNDDGDLFLLRDQDRSLWDRSMIAEGLKQLDLSAAGDEISTYHLQAGIAAQHAIAPTYAQTDWAEIVSLYDQLYQLNPNPVVALNRAIALSRWKGAEEGIAALRAIEGDPALARYHLLPATLGELWSEIGDHNKAAAYYRAALKCQCTAPERRLLEERLRRSSLAR